jgi:Pyruvate/2-oxoacid:ferredoxin oxidoreductase delta subunit
MIRKIVKIDEDKCDGCGQCVPSCAEGAIQIVDGKAKLVSDIYCDGLGACLGECPKDAITIEEREAPAFDEAAAQEHDRRQQDEEALPCGCPGSAARTIEREQAPAAQPAAPAQSGLSHWPVQLKLVPFNAPYFQEADLLLVADCVPFALADFHARFLQGNPIAIGCPKLDDANFYVEKLADILRESSVKSLTVVHMEVPCCRGLTRIAAAAIDASGAAIPVNDVTISISGEVLGQTCPQT